MSTSTVSVSGAGVDASQTMSMAMSMGSGSGSAPAAASTSSPRGSNNGTAYRPHSPQQMERAHSINLRELLSTPDPENEFYQPVFDALDDDTMREAFIEAQRAQLEAIENQVLSRALEQSRREAEATTNTRPLAVQQPRRGTPAPVLIQPVAPQSKYALVSPSELGVPRRHSRSGSNSSTTSASSVSSSSSSSSASSSSTSTSASSVLSSSPTNSRLSDEATARGLARSWKVEGIQPALMEAARARKASVAAAVPPVLLTKSATPLPQTSAPKVTSHNPNATSSSSSFSTSKVPVISSASTSQRPTLVSSSSPGPLSNTNTPSSTASAKAMAQDRPSASRHQSSNQISYSHTSTATASGSSGVTSGMTPASIAPASRNAGPPSKSVTVVQPIPILASKASTRPFTGSPSLSSSPSAYAMKRSSSRSVMRSSPSAREVAEGLMSSSLSPSYSRPTPPPSNPRDPESFENRHGQLYHLRDQFRCVRCCAGHSADLTALWRCGCPLSCLMAIETCLDGFDTQFSSMASDESTSALLKEQHSYNTRSRSSTTSAWIGGSGVEKQRQAFLDLVLSRRDKTTRVFETVVSATLDNLLRTLNGFKKVIARPTSHDSESLDDSGSSSRLDEYQRLTLQQHVHSLFGSSLLPSLLHTFLSNDNVTIWFKFSDIYLRMVSLLRLIVECECGGVLREPLHHNARPGSEAGGSSIWALVLNRLDGKKEELMMNAALLKFGETRDKVERLYSGIMWLVLQDLTD